MASLAKQTKVQRKRRDEKIAKNRQKKNNKRVEKAKKSGALYIA